MFWDILYFGLNKSIYVLKRSYLASSLLLKNLAEVLGLTEISVVYVDEGIFDIKSLELLPTTIFKISYKYCYYLHNSSKVLFTKLHLFLTISAAILSYKMLIFSFLNFNYLSIGSSSISWELLIWPIISFSLLYSLCLIYYPSLTALLEWCYFSAELVFLRFLF